LPHCASISNKLLTGNFPYRCESHLSQSQTLFLRFCHFERILVPTWLFCYITLDMGHTSSTPAAATAAAQDEASPILTNTLTLTLLQATNVGAATQCKVPIHLQSVI